MHDSCDVSVRRPVVIVVDDDPAVSNSLKFALEIEGYSVRLYSNGRDLLAASELPAWGCLIIDHRLPRMLGLELVAELRSRGVTLPALLITTHPSRDLRADATRAGIAVIEKPLLGEALLEGIRDVFAWPAMPA